MNMVMTDKIACLIGAADIDAEVERLRVCWARANEAGDEEAKKFFERAAKNLKSESAYARYQASRM